MAAAETKGGFTKRVKGAILMSRPLNGLMASAAVLIGWYVSVELPQRLPITVPLLMLSTFGTVSAANIANDLDDVQVDRKAHPDRAIASGLISRSSANFIMVFIWTITLAGLMLTILLDIGTLTFAICVLGFLMMVYYEKVAKSRGLQGNIVISALTSMPFLLGASVPGLSAKVVLLCPMAFLANLSRELLKDMKDMVGDKGWRVTVPLVHGPAKTLIVSDISLAGAVIASSFPITYWGWEPLYAVPVAAADLLFISVMVLSRKMVGPSTGLLKVGMVIGLMGFIFL